MLRVIVNKHFQEKLYTIFKDGLKKLQQRSIILDPDNKTKHFPASGRDRRRMRMMLFGLLFPVLLITALAYAFGWRPGNTTLGSFGSRQTPLDVLKERYARGEISREVYEEMKSDLQ